MQMVKPLLTILLVISMGSSALADGYSVDKEMNVAVINDIDIGYLVAGEFDAPAVILIMGLTASHRLWPEDFVNQLTAFGYRVVLFDNRDTGASQRMDHLGEPTLWWEMIKNAIGFGIDAPYSLGDMAKDTIGVMDELGIKQAHIVGASMGGMIAQTVAARYPERTLTLTSIMSTTGAPDLPEPQGDAGSNLQDLGGAEGDVAKQLNDLGMYPKSMPRQLLAIVAAGDRTLEVASIKSPTLVVHGKDDPLLPVAHGQRTHETISGSSYVVFEGMAHDLPEAVVGKLVLEMVNFFGPS
ncbi:MAG: pimeloyl-ACP methyl ester carboxylesterase [Limisphaerales bacterium]|jgi:pimeloyl-ACP methyl ester carboxylesterase